MQKYNPQKIEKKWQKYWEENKINFCDLYDKTKKKFYNLVMFFYPSGDKIHIGHGYNYTGSDVYGRYKRLDGFNVFEPMGYDAFGLPAENYAIKSGVHPAVSTKENTEYSKQQLKEMGLMYDWAKEIDTSSPKYYKWTQWLFGILYKAGLAYRAEAPVNWCPSCKTVLANEQVVSGKCERCDSEVIQKNLKQWFFKITDYADRLLDGHKKVNWPDKTILMQKNWIGKSEGAEVNFEVVMVDEKSVNPRFQSGGQEDGHQHRRPINWSAGEGEAASPTPPPKWWVNQEEKKFFVTFPTHKREPYFQKTRAAQKMTRIFESIIVDKKYQVLELVVMPDHVHLIVKRNQKEDLEKIVKNLKGISSRIYKDKGIEEHLWAKGYEYEEIPNQLSLDKILKYMRTNPEKKGLIDKEKRLLSCLMPQLKVFTTRPDTLFGATFMVVAPEHPLVIWWLKWVKDSLLVNPRLKSLEQGDNTTNPRPINWSGKGEVAPTVPPINWRVNRGDIDAVETYINKAHQKSDLERTDLAKEKTGVELRGIKVINPVNNQEIPIFIADYVLPHYGTGAIMAVPAHDERDFEFAKKYGLEIAEVVKHTNNDANECEYHANVLTKVFEGEGVAINSGEFNGLSTKEFKEKIIKWLEEKGLGKKAVNYKLRDWLISRQRYWGAPIPVIYCHKCLEETRNKKQETRIDKTEIDGEEYAVVLVPEKDLPVKLPDLDDFKPTDEGESPLARSKEFVNVKCPKCGGGAKRSTETMDTFVCSSWYFLRFVNPDLKDKPFDKKMVSKWLPIDQYCGGAEHACMHLLYARFITKVLHDQGLINFDEPFTKLNHQGMILASNGSKMSKSKDNVVIPDDYIKKYGADVFRMYILFLAPFEQGGAWNDRGIVGIKRFLERMWKLQERLQDTRYKIQKNPKSQITNYKQIPNSKSKIQNNNETVERLNNKRVERLLHQTIKKVTEDIENFHFNTAISQLMILVNELDKQEQISLIHYSLFIILLSPFAPHIAEELWNKLGHKKSIFYEKWPEYNSKLIKEEEIELVIQVNGKVRERIKVSADISESDATKAALNSEKIQKWLAGKEPKKIIFVKGKLVNVVT